VQTLDILTRQEAAIGPVERREKDFPAYSRGIAAHKGKDRGPFFLSRRQKGAKARMCRVKSILTKDAGSVKKNLGAICSWEKKRTGCGVREGESSHIIPEEKDSFNSAESND